MGREYVDADKWLQDIVRDKRYWEQKRQTIHQREKQMEQTIERYEKEMEELRRQRKDILQKARDEATGLLDAANARIENTIREIRESQAEKEQTRLARRTLEDFRIGKVEQEDEHDEAIERKMEQLRRRQERKKEKNNAREGGASGASSRPSQPSPPGGGGASALTVGSTVRMKGQTSVGTIERIDGKQATVLFGLMRTNVRLDRLQAATAPNREENTAGVTFLSRQTQNQMREKSLNFRQDIDVRGMRGEEALNAIRLYIDDAIQVGVDRVRILHGTGTGILRQLIRQYLRTVPAVKDARDEHVQFGGAGITVVDFR